MNLFLLAVAGSQVVQVAAGEPAAAPAVPMIELPTWELEVLAVFIFLTVALFMRCMIQDTQEGMESGDR